MRIETKLFVALVLGAAVAVSGCASNSSGPSAVEGENTPTADPPEPTPKERSSEPVEPAESGVKGWENRTRLVVAQLNGDMTAAGACVVAAFPEIELPREDGRVLEPAERIEFKIRSDLTRVGVQVGHAFDSEPIQWLETVWASEVNGESTFEVDVAADQYELPGENHTRWSFHWRTNYPLVDTPIYCYSGPATGSAEVLIEAVRTAE